MSQLFIREEKLQSKSNSINVPLLVLIVHDARPRLGSLRRIAEYIRLLKERIHQRGLAVIDVRNDCDVAEEE
jgi:hypothetical protein